MNLRAVATTSLFVALPLVAQKITEPAPPLEWKATHNFGDIPTKSLSELRDSVVLLEFISVRQNASAPEVAKLDTLHFQHAEAGLVVVTVTSEAADDVAKWVKKYNVKRPVAVGFNKDYDVSGVPDAFLIDKDGKLLWHGHPSAIDRQLLTNALVGAMAAIVVPGLEDLQVLRRSKDYGATYKKGQQMLAAGGLSERAQAQATHWIKQYEKFVVESTEAANKAEAEKNLYGMWVALRPIADYYQGVPGADAAKTRFDALVADPKNMREIEAGKLFASAQAREAEFDFDGAHAIYKDMATKFSNTAAGKSAATAFKTLEKDGKLGYDHRCPYCKAASKACPQHDKKKKKKN